MELKLEGKENEPTQRDVSLGTNGWYRLGESRVLLCRSSCLDVVLPFRYSHLNVYLGSFSKNISKWEKFLKIYLFTNLF